MEHLNALVENWWSILIALVEHWWRIGGANSSFWWSIGGELVEQTKRLGGELVEHPPCLGGAMIEYQKQSDEASPGEVSFRSAPGRSGPGCRSGALRITESETEMRPAVPVAPASPAAPPGGKLSKCDYPP